MKTFVMKNCGCRLKRHELLVVQSSGYRCIHHPKNKVDYVEMHCCDCGKKVVVSPKATSTTRCKLCKTTRRKELQKIADLKRRSPNYKKILDAQHEYEKASYEAWDCANRNECLSDAVEKGFECLQCHNCERYNSMVTA